MYSPNENFIFYFFLNSPGSIHLSFCSGTKENSMILLMKNARTYSVWAWERDKETKKKEHQWQGLSLLASGGSQLIRRGKTWRLWIWQGWWQQGAGESWGGGGRSFLLECQCLFYKLRLFRFFFYFFSSAWLQEIKIITKLNENSYWTFFFLDFMLWKPPDWNLYVEHSVSHLILILLQNDMEIVQLSGGNLKISRSGYAHSVSTS